MTRRSRRLTLIGAALSILMMAAGVALYALSDNIVFFYSPTDVVQRSASVGARLRVGGLVKPETVVKSGDETVNFVVTDGEHDLKVTYKGLLPDLFREGQGVVAEGVLESSGRLHADTILAKHDERYMPREVVETLKKQGRWQEGQTASK